MSPTQLTLRELRLLGWEHQTVEYWHAHAQKRVDLFGFIDIVALPPGSILGIQTTTRSNMWGRRNKIRTEKKKQAIAWLQGGGVIEIWGWDEPPEHLRVDDEKYRVRKEVVTPSSLGIEK